MTTPPYNYDVSHPATTDIPANFPANDQAFRATVQAAVSTVVDATTGLGPIVQKYTTTQKNALVNPPTGLLVYDITLTKLQMNNGTPGSPTWVGVVLA